MSVDINIERRFINHFIAVQELDTDLYFAPKSYVSWNSRGTFGGQTIAQASHAAGLTVRPGFFLHSMHCYFLRAGDDELPTIYKISRTKDGSSFSSRTVLAIQNGRPILTLQASFHNEAYEPTSLPNYQPSMPTVRHHSLLENLEKHAAKIEVHNKRLAQPLGMPITDVPVELKPLNLDVYIREAPSDQRSMLCWIKTYGELGNCLNGPMFYQLTV